MKVSTSAELVFPARKGSHGDYHKNMDYDTFLKWVMNRLFPAFEKKYPGKKLIAVMDNAPYHVAKGSDVTNPTSMIRKPLMQALFDLKIPKVCSVHFSICSSLIESICFCEPNSICLLYYSLFFRFPALAPREESKSPWNGWLAIQRRLSG